MAAGLKALVRENRAKRKAVRANAKVNRAEAKFTKAKERAERVNRVVSDIIAHSE